MIYYSRASPHVRINEKVITSKEANKLNLIPLSVGCFAKEHWILINMANDCVKVRRNYAFVKSSTNEIEIWASPVTLGTLGTR